MALKKPQKKTVKKPTIADLRRASNRAEIEEALEHNALHDTLQDIDDAQQKYQKDIEKRVRAFSKDIVAAVKRNGVSFNPVLVFPREGKPSKIDKFIGLLITLRGGRLDIKFIDTKK
jgi:uncharacterized ferritin-like protein (DUF455 family)